MHSSDRPRFAILGAGMSGILAGIKLKQAGYDFTIFEKAAAVGGTWHLHSYPGLACDVKAAAYTFPGEANPDWTHSFAESISNETSLGTGRIALSDTAAIDDTVCCPDSGALLCSEWHSNGITHCDAHSASGSAANIVSIDYAQCSSVECTDSGSLGGSDQRCR